MPFFNCRVEGQLPGGDLFVFGFWADASLGVQAVADEVQSWINDVWTNHLAAIMTTNTTVARCVVGEYTSITGAQQARAENAVSLAGTVDEAITPPLPGDVAVVVSLQTNLANRSGRGRFYLPAPVTSVVTDDGKLDLTTRDDIAAGVRDAFQTFNAAASPGLIVASRTLNTGTAVQRVAVGDKFDTQRRRENSWVESREVLSL